MHPQPYASPVLPVRRSRSAPTTRVSLTAAPSADDLRTLWDHLRATWLDAAEHRSRSSHTRRAYTKAVDLWLEYLASLAVPPWAATTVHVRGWQSHLRASGNTDATVNARLSAASSFYTFVIREVHLVDGVERTAFADAQGLTRANPFCVGNLRRAKVKQYGKARPLSSAELGKLFAYLEAQQQTLSGARNYALLLTYFLTAARNGEVVRMRWGDIRPSRAQPGSYVVAWRGKGGKVDTIALPTRAYQAIVTYLQRAGRYCPEDDSHIRDDEYIWAPLVTHGLANLQSAQHGHLPRGYISEKNAVRILQTSLRNAAIPDAHQVRIHDLRHSFAHLFRGDLEKLRKILHHESLATTGIYVRSLEDPADDYSEAIWQQLGL